MANSTIIDSFLEHCNKTPGKVYMTQPLGDGEVKDWTFQETLDEAKKMAGYLESQHFEDGSKIAICSKNCAEWIIADLAIWLCGFVSIPVYPTLTAKTVAYILEHSESKLLFVGKLDKKPWDEMKGGVPGDLPKISFPMKPEGDWGENWEDVIAKATPIAEPVTHTPEELATIVYTSGSTGMPKGVMVSFKAMKAASESMVQAISITPKDRYLSYLPLSHVMERFVGECVSMVSGMHIFFAESLTTFVADLARCRPTVFISVPRLWTKFQMGVHTKMPPEKLQFLIKIPLLGWFVKRKVLKGLGLNCVRVAGSGSAPIPAELVAWYRELGLNLLEGYGMTENFALSHLTKPGFEKTGYVGVPYPGVEQRLNEQGEIEVLSPGMMMGYYKNDEATKEATTEDGWLRTGDRGEIDEMGRLKITGRTKEIFKTSKGKYVAPAPIENKLNVSQHIELSCVTGTGYPQPFALVQLSEAIKNMAKAEQEQRDNIEAQLKEFLKDRVNQTLDPHEHLQCLVIIHDDWLPENGFLTPTQKLQRRSIEEAYKGSFDSWVDQKTPIVWHGW